ncbi:SKP1-like protein 1A [Tripterygium wilfordii]|uniref:SKP1-like protein 1A n=1 Tax=Tripterygium wilfordii TaxID=458696 RepID=UPI0018F84DAA|nr:SKP1-like protein 1A [Tripterygium wilfordii]
MSTITTTAVTTLTEVVKKITVKASDGGLIDIDESVAMEIPASKAYFGENSGVNNIAPLPLDVPSDLLSRIVAYVEDPVAKSADEGELKAFNKKFLEEKSDGELKEMLIAASDLEIEALVEVLAQGIADRIKNMSVESMRKFFGVENDFTAEEEEEIRKEYPWAFEGVDAVHD